MSKRFSTDAVSSVAPGMGDEWFVSGKLTEKFLAHRGAGKSHRFIQIQIKSNLIQNSKFQSMRKLLSRDRESRNEKTLHPENDHLRSDIQ
jgi:hypothetical protein